jgi:hypothetical protein
MKNFESACTLLLEPHDPGTAAAGHMAPVIFWHRELPPLDAVALAEHTVEATSIHVPGTLAHRNELWSHCYRDLMQRTTMRLRQEVERLGGRYVHVLEESIDSRHDDAKREAWLAGRFTYTLMGTAQKG